MKAATKFTAGTRVRATASGWTGVVVKQLPRTTGDGVAVRVRWDDWCHTANPFAERESRVSNPSLNLELHS